jgi:type IV pilus assembly protein PilA
MIARIRKSIEEKDKGFTLIELLVVMIIIGILAAIAIPVFLNQRKKANDTAAVSDVSTIGKEVATYYVDATTALANGDVAIAGGRYTIDYDGTANDIGKTSNGVTAVTLVPGAADLTEQTWCVEVTYSGGTHTEVSYSAVNGLNKTAGCA